MEYIFKIPTLLLLIALIYGENTIAADSILPRLTLREMEYVGAFRISGTRFGDSQYANLTYASGRIEYNPDRHSIFIVGHVYMLGIAEFPVPALVKSMNIADLNMVNSAYQNFTDVLSRVPEMATVSYPAIGGMEYVSGTDGPELLVTGYSWYDASHSMTKTHFVIRSPGDISGSQIDGMFEFEGSPGHLCGWISPIPQQWQEQLGGTHISGFSDGMSIVGRASVGPSAFVFNASDIVGKTEVSEPVSTTKLLDFSTSLSLHNFDEHPEYGVTIEPSESSGYGGGSYYFNELKTSEGLHVQNNIWTKKDTAEFGFIVPGTRTYLTLGPRGGHQEGIGYKITDSTGRLSGGPACFNASDHGLSYYMFDIDDLIQVKEGVKQAHEVKPYEYGEFPLAYFGPFRDQHTSALSITGGTFDPANGTLYIAVAKADKQGTYTTTPIFAAYRFNIGNPLTDQPPIAVADSALVYKASPLAMSEAKILANDFDFDADESLSITGYNTSNLEGTLTNNNDGSLTYTPPEGAADYSSDYFSYEVSDENGHTGTARVTLHILPESWIDTVAPHEYNLSVSQVTAGGATVTWDTDEPATHQVRLYDTDGNRLQTTAVSTALSTKHSVALTELSPNTTYRASAISTDANQNGGISFSVTFVTPNTSEAPPKPSGLRLTRTVHEQF